MYNWTFFAHPCTVTFLVLEHISRPRIEATPTMPLTDVDILREIHSRGRGNRFRLTQPSRYPTHRAEMLTLRPCSSQRNGAELINVHASRSPISGLRHNPLFWANHCAQPSIQTNYPHFQFEGKLNPVMKPNSASRSCATRRLEVGGHARNFLQSRQTIQRLEVTVLLHS